MSLASTKRCQTAAIATAAPISGRRSARSEIPTSTPTTGVTTPPSPTTTTGLTTLPTTGTTTAAVPTATAAYPGSVDSQIYNGISGSPRLRHIRFATSGDQMMA